ncbi:MULTISPECIES: exodeoxyribonuclease VII small subunit [Clostridium]|uniref:exodeoxyribonuclease VII small subunit n=1 Tax=Clostridium TaxID=1485 RepID=UPI0021527027|nr:exodeoxyribonuclease VII small subunit [Clostridium sp. LY3-2]MCR6515859.1 exodeoxyribonuclease VII small subunit [Clostridium sp. LY3-2]
MAKKVSYEDMYKELNEIIDNLDNNKLSLENSMKEYEKGVKLINKLNKTLSVYEGKLSIVRDNEEVELDENGKN